MLENISQKNSRIETKILIKSSNYYGIMDSIKNSNKRFREIYHPRYINNIYFDSYNFQSYHQNLNGDLNKRKIRIRWYGDLAGEIHPTLEYKIKKNFNCHKQKYKIKPFSIDKISFKKNIHQSIRHSKIPQAVKLDLKSLFPIFINRYRRQYFLSKDGSIRLTIDRFLKYYRIINLKFPIRVNLIIVELKYNSINASDISLIVDEFGSRWSTFSKYFLGTDIIYT